MRPEPLILAVDRNRHNLELLRRGLGQAGFALLPAADLAAFDQVLRGPQGVAAALLTVGGCDERIDHLFERCERLQQRSIPYLVLSPHKSATIQRECLLRGARGILVKPVALQDLVVNIRSIAGERPLPRAAYPGTILLALHQREDRRLLAELLGRRYQVIESETLDPPFDLCILDALALGSLWERVRARKQAEQPALLPFLLVVARKGVGMVTHHLWESVDELIGAPIEKRELEARVEILLRARELSLQNTALQRRLEAELVRAAEVQAELLPRAAPALPGFELEARCLPTREVGGDFYDWQEIWPHDLWLALGDAMGKGIPAALLMATTRAALRAVAGAHPPAVAVDLCRRALEADLVRSCSLVTLFHARLDVATRRLRYVDAGHGHAFVRRRGGQVEALEAPGPALGIPLGEEPRTGELTFAAGDALVVYSDGLVEAQMDRPAGLPLTRTALAAALDGAESAAEMVERLVLLAGGERGDDVTVLVLRCTAGGPP